MIAVDPREPRFAALAHRLDAPEFSCALQVSGDGGRTFIPVDPVPALPPGAEKCYAPEIGFDGQSVLHYLFVGLAGRGNQPMGVFLTSSQDYGRTFSAPIQVLGPHNFGVRMAIDRSKGERGRIHLAWLAANADPAPNSLPPPPNPIMAAYSDDGGRSFSTPVQVSDRRRELVVAPALALGDDHRVIVAYYDLGSDRRDYHGLEGPTWDQPWSVVVATSSDGGHTFAPGVVVDDGIAPPERVLLIFTMPSPALAADGKGDVYIAWHDGRNRDWDVFLRRSADGGRTWAPARRLNDDPVGNGRHQYQPRLAVSPNGRVDAIFYDRRNDAENNENDVYYAFSTDRGATFSPNIKLTSRPSDPTVGPTYIDSPPGLVEYGSRMGLASLDNAALAAWTDTRLAPIYEYQDVFAVRVDLARR